MASRVTIENELARLLTLIAADDKGASLDHLRTCHPELSRTTLLRRLDTLLDRQAIVRDGRSRSARYRIVTPLAPPTDSHRETKLSDRSVPLSPAASAIMTSVSGPVGSRKPVGYNRAFLDAYRPNQTSYLTTAEKKRLAELGATSLSAEHAGTYAQTILQRLLIDLSWNSSRLEGNTYSLLDTQRLIEFGQATEGKAPTDAQMILNHKQAIEFLVQSASDVSFDRRTVLNLHALLADNLLPDPQAPGRLRFGGVGISGSVFHPLENPHLIAECFDVVLAKADAIRDPFEQAFFAMVQLPYLQPFDDVNKRVSRLAANIPFIRRNLAPIAFVDVPSSTYTQGVLGVYELNRVELLRDVFLWAYERSAHRYAAIRQAIGEPDAFRLTYRTQLKTVVGAVVRDAVGRQQAARHIATWAGDHISPPDRDRFIEAAETELLGLTEGNFARYQVTPREYDAWRAVWTAPGRKGRKKPST